MNDERSFERTARAWLEQGANQAPDRAIQAVLLAIETTPQERDLRIPWRFPTMNTPVRVGMAAVIGLLLLGAGIYLFGGGGPGLGGQPRGPTPTPTPSRPRRSEPGPNLAPCQQTVDGRPAKYAIYPAAARNDYRRLVRAGWSIRRGLDLAAACYRRDNTAAWHGIGRLSPDDRG